MDVENELKYLLPQDFNNSALLDWDKSVIMQGYLNNAITTVYRDNNGKPIFAVTVTKDNGENIRFETHNVSEYQFGKLSANALSEEDGVYTLPKPTRIRNKSGKFSITYKQWVDDELIEVEDRDNVTKSIFDSFQPYASDFVYKDRYEKQINDEEWVVDYLRDYNTDAVYYVHSEVEMPYGRSQPLHRPDFITKAYIFAVPQDDERFTNQCLSNQEHAQSLYRQYAVK